MRKVFDSGHGLSDAGLATLGDAVRAIDNVVSHINESTAFSPSSPSLLARLHELEAELDAGSAARRQRYQRLGAGPRAAGVAERRRRRPLRRGSLRRAASARPAAEEFDHEIANIYSEEATELLEARRGLADRLESGPQGQAAGRRAAASTAHPQGRRAHGGHHRHGRFEPRARDAWCIQIDGGAVAGDDHAHAVMQASLDELARMRDLVSAGTLPGAAARLLRANPRA